MTLAIFAGVWALAFGHISVTSSLKMKGTQARVFGLALILAASFVLPHISQLLVPYAPKLLTGNDGLKQAFDTGIGAFAVFATAWAVIHIGPKLKVPTVTFAMKRLRA